MPKRNEPPVSPPPLPPDFPDIPQNPPSALQPAPDSFARPDKVEGTTHPPAEPETLRKVLGLDVVDKGQNAKAKITLAALRGAGHFKVEERPSRSTIPASPDGAAA